MTPITLPFVTRVVAEVLDRKADTFTPDQPLKDLGADELDIIDIEISLEHARGLFEAEQEVISRHINPDATCNSIAEWLDTL